MTPVPAGLTAADTVVIPAADAHALMTKVLVARGADAAEAATQADLLLEGDLRGQHSHGIRRLPVLAQRLENGVTQSAVRPKFEWQGESRLHVEGNRGMGPVVAHRILDEIIPRSRRTGVVAASLNGAGHIGMLAPYVERIAGEGCVGIVLTISEALVAPWGGNRAMIGTNPIGIGVPTDDQPLVLDMSTAAVSAGKVLDYAARGETIPLGWAVDERGDATTDAAAAVKGAISPFGGPKGFALGLAFEALVGVLAESAFGRDVFGTLDTDIAPTKGDLFIVLPTRSGSPAISALTDYFDQLRREGVDGKKVQIPGDRARAMRADRLRNGIPLDAALWRDVNLLVND